MHLGQQPAPYITNQMSPRTTEVGHVGKESSPTVASQAIDFQVQAPTEPGGQMADLLT